MGQTTEISWADHTFNPWRGCTKVSPGCTNCYAETLSKRNPAVLGEWGPAGARAIAAESYWREPEKWNAKAEKDGVRRRVFCLSLGDIAERREELHLPRARLGELIRRTPLLDWLLLSKRVGDDLDDAYVEMGFASSSRPFGLPSNVWPGESVEDQERADLRVPALLRFAERWQARGRLWLSLEPLLGPVNLRQGLWLPPGPPFKDAGPFISWLVVGGESGANARPMHPAWIHYLRDQAQAAGVAFHFKQWGEWALTGAAGTTQGFVCERGSSGRFTREAIVKTCARDHGDSCRKQVVYRVGKKAAGRELDGRTWDEFPA